MTPEAQRIAIAEACGLGRWTWIDPRGGDPYEWKSPEGYKMWSKGPPDYLSDLNAMHEAEKVLTREQRHEFVERLRHILNDLNRSDMLWNGATAFDYCHATAAQRAEAFLRALGKWDDSL